MTNTPWTARRSAEKRFAKTAASPKSFNPSERTAEVVMSTGSPVDRGLYVERLKISPSSVDLGRMQRGGVALLDSHQQSGLSNILGRVQSVRFQNGEMIGVIEFAKTQRGNDAMELVANGMVPGTSIGYVVSRWRFEDEEGRELDPAHDRIPSDGSVTAWATRFELMELSLVSVPADSSAVFRAASGHVDPEYNRDALARAEARIRMRARQRMVGRMVGRLMK
ncbi:HK97 family phage prohead protease [Bradyrhizobium macuxiense]|uniref:HK97 family phage prohead protease n=1 Tax=Bradyrhizobium macuxiense TaxID=1755647 RepID=UPI0009E92A74|nr:HK97 family phage prohead protease [Bradyrhizobium macuxiense]